ncbi:MAG: glycosyltransferase [Candidatus Omnitrophota bacterium]
MPMVVLMCRIDGFSGGVERHILQLANHLDCRRFEPVVCAIANQGELYRIANKEGIEKEFIPMPSRLGVGSAARVLAEIARRRGAGLLHTFGLRSNALAARARQSLAIPWIVRLPNINSTDYANPLRGWISHWYNNRLIRRADALQVISPQLRQYVEGWKRPPRHIYLIRNGVDLDEFDREDVASSIRDDLQIPFDAPVIGTTGRLVPVKGYDLLIEAFAAVRKHSPAARLVIVGEGPEQARLERIARQKGVEDAVCIAGYTPDVKPYLAAFDLFVCSSHSEGVPNSVLEAMAIGLPVIATKVGGMESIIEDRREGTLIPPGEVGALANALHVWLHRREEYIRMGELARARIRREFSLEQMVNAVETMYDEAVARFAADQRSS